jgi:hypothetical protein
MPDVHRIGFTQIGDKGARDRQYRIKYVERTASGAVN